MDPHRRPRMARTVTFARTLAILCGLCFAAACSGVARSADAAGGNGLTLADVGQTSCTIVIGEEAPEGVRYAAQELADCLKQMTGVDFETIGDGAPKSAHEIVLGPTNRKSLADLPPQRRPQVLEGFAILPEQGSLYILGNSTRGTLYGVYDWLEQDLGVRFLGHGPMAIDGDEVTIGAINHVPNLFYIDHNIRVLVAHEVRCVYLLSTEGPGTDVFALRSYLMAQWWYAIEFEMPGISAAAVPDLSFDAVDSAFEASIDGEKIGERYGNRKIQMEKVFWPNLDLFLKHRR